MKIKDNFVSSLQKALNLVGGLDIDKNLVIIKPNICTQRDVSGAANVTIQSISVVIDEVLKRKPKSKIRIVESDSTAKYIDKAFKKFGYFQLQKHYQDHGFDVSLVNLSQEPTQAVVLNGLYLKKIEIPKILLQPSYFISVAKAKTHELTKITGVLKNQFGLIPSKEKRKYHKHINEIIVDINMLIKPNIGIIDGQIGMEGSIHGRTQNLGLILCGTDPVAVDATLARVMGFNPTKIKHLKLAEKIGLGTIYPKVVGEQIESVMTRFREPHTTIAMLGEYLPENFLPIARQIYRNFVQRR